MVHCFHEQIHNLEESLDQGALIVFAYIFQELNESFEGFA